MADEKVRVGAADVSRVIVVKREDADAPSWGLGEKLAVVGTEVLRVDGYEKASGGARYPADVNRPGMAFARLVRCPHAHANVNRVDVEVAKTLPGVVAATDLGRKRVTFAGAPVAALCAETPSALDD